MKMSGMTACISSLPKPLIGKMQKPCEELAPSSKKEINSSYPEKQVEKVHCENKGEIFPFSYPGECATHQNLNDTHEVQRNLGEALLLDVGGGLVEHDDIEPAHEQQANQRGIVDLVAGQTGSPLAAIRNQDTRN